MATVNKEDVYFEYEDLTGTSKKEFEPHLALAYLLLNDILVVNNFWWKEVWPNDAQQMISFGVNCSDVFGYACADAEELRYDELENLFQHVAQDEVWGSIVWCIKKRKLRPIDEVYVNLLNNDLWKDTISKL